MIVGMKQPVRLGRRALPNYAAIAMGDLDPNAILSPSRDVLRTETDELLSRLTRLAQDWFNSDANTVSQDLLSRWDAFVNDTKSWDSGPDFIAHVLGTTWRDDLIDRETKFNGFLQEFRGAGVATTTPAFTFSAGAPSTLDKLFNAAGNAADKATKPLQNALSTIETVAIVGGLAAVGFIFYLTFETGRTARAIAPRMLR